MAVGARKPLMSAAQIRQRTGLELGRLQAVVHPSGEAPRLLCFDRTTSEQGDRQPQYLIITDEQLEQIQRVETGGVQSRESIKRR